ncbi:hypothetical protein [Lentilactobacillus otakiensis]|uniref:hypothetical protein n=1 Tax=Lentilactobacillus otakiensis TaxID=481720 RepID=UPI003D184B76
MKKFATIITVASLALPLALAAPISVSAATTPTTTKTAAKGVTLTLGNPGVTNYKKAKTFHTKDASPVVFKAFFYADAGKATFTKKGTLKAHSTWKVTKAVKTVATGKYKAHTFYYVKGQGYVYASALTKGAAVNAD